MNRWTRINLVLCVLVAAQLVAHLWPDERGPTSLLTALTPAAITSARVERGNTLTLAMQRTPEGWQLTHPEPGPAAPRRVDQLLSVARAPVAYRYAVGDDRARYGLDRPGVVLQLDGLRLAFGDRDPSQQARYVLVGDQVCVIDDLYFNLLTLPARHYAGR